MSLLCASLTALLMAVPTRADAQDAAPAQRRGLSGDHWQRCLANMGAERYRDAVGAALDFIAAEPRRYGLVERYFENIARADARALAPGEPSPRVAAVAAALRDKGAESRDRLPAAMLRAALALASGQPESGLEALLEVAGTADVLVAIYQFAMRCEAAGFDAVAARCYEHYADSERVDPQQLPASLLKQAQLYERQRRFTLAIAVYRRLAERFPNGPRGREGVYRHALLLLRERRDDEGARRLLLPLAGRGGHMNEAIELLLAECDVVAGELERARQRFLPRFANGARAPARFGFGRLLFFEGQFDEALAHLDSLVSAEPGHELANDALALILLIEEQRELGHEQALRMYARSRLLSHQGRWADAARARASLASVSAGFGIRALLDQARECEERALSDSALAVYATIISGFPQHRDTYPAHLARARLLEQRGRGHEALRALESVLLAFPDEALAPQVRLDIQRLRTLFGEAG